MAARDSKLALAEAARLLDCDRPQARDFLRRVQQLAGSQVAYRTIVMTMVATSSCDPEVVVPALISIALDRDEVSAP